MITIQGTRTKQMSPWEYLENWAQSDRDYETSTADWLSRKMKEKYPGNYRIVLAMSPKTWWDPHPKIVFDDPAEETWFRLKYPG